MTDDAGSGWRTVASWDEAPAVFAALVALEPGQEYTRSEVAETAGLSLKTLYLVDTLDALVAAGALERIDDDGETRYVVDGSHPVVSAARRFDEAVAAAAE